MSVANIAFFMQPKAMVAYLYSDYTIRQALEKMNHHGYSAVPVIDRDGKYVGTVSEGDLLWFIVTGEGDTPHTIDVEDLEKFKLSELSINTGKYQAVSIAANIDELLTNAMNQNFIPIVDDRESFIGIVTRKAVIKYFYDHNIVDDGEGLYEKN